jgi:transcriptional regulator with XRE-family HTH domain
MLYMNQMPGEWSEAVLRRVGKNIRKKRTAAGWTINRMYAETGIARVTIMRWESGKRSPKLDDLLWVCKCTGWRLSEILGGAK